MAPCRSTIRGLPSASRAGFDSGFAKWSCSIRRARSAFLAPPFLCYKARPRGHGETGRRKGLKIPRLARAVPVRVRLPAPLSALDVTLQSPLSLARLRAECESGGAKFIPRTRISVKQGSSAATVLAQPARLGLFRGPGVYFRQVTVELTRRPARYRALISCFQRKNRRTQGLA